MKTTWETTIKIALCTTGRVLLFLLLPVLVQSCTRSQKEIIRVSGSSTVLPVVSKAADLFMLNNADLMITVSAGGSGVGVNQVGEKIVQIGMISRNVTNEEIKKFPDVHFVEHIIGRDAVAVSVSSEIYDAGIQALKIENIRSIFKGKTKNWKELGGPDKDILVIDKEKGRGTRHVFMEAIFGNKNENAPGADLVLGSNNEELTALTQSNSAIGMLSLAWLNNDVKGVGITEKGNTVFPSKQALSDGTYPV
ncbi:MAG: substrate-binding domain-containing protein, partial [Nitrospinota bacterium]